MNEVETKRSRRRLGGVVALAAGVALLIGGGTYSLWTDSETIETGGTITAGDLDIEKKGNPSFWDVSAGRADATDNVTGTANQDAVKGHVIDSLDTYRVVPGDEVAGVYQYQVKLEGDNLVAKLSLQSKVNENNSSFMTYKYQLFDASGNALTAKTDLTMGSDHAAIAYLQAPATGQSAGLNDYINNVEVPIITWSGTDANLTLVLFASFASSTQNQDYAASGAGAAQGVAALKDIKVTLTQADRTDSTPQPSATPSE
ncbi:MAG: alternate-type signal peptide domain-containing protein [Propionibacteriaceae bacterium]|jgi:alternate signal-mediated exported protein|nr:alternate-type signal peptide domain-containing protein [Propionibacteriaceae bacterium]